MAALAGTATFEGQAAGQYVTRFSLDGPALAGTFTVDAGLAANFGDDAQASTLAAGGIGSDGALGGGATGRIQSNQSGTGSWTASFFGNDRNDRRPGSLAGAFVLNFVSIADLAGGFAARNTSPDE